MVDLGDGVTPVALREAKCLEAVVRRDLNRGRRHGDHDGPVLEGLERARPDLAAGDFVPLGVSLDDAGLDTLHDDQGRLVEHLSRIGQFDPEGAELPASRPPAHPEDQSALGQDVKLDGLLHDAQRIVPGQDDRGGDQVDRAGLRRDIGEQLERVRARRVIGEMMFDRPDVVETHGFGFDGEIRFLHEALDIWNPVEVLISQMQSYSHDRLPVELMSFARLFGASASEVAFTPGLPWRAWAQCLLVNCLTGTIR